MFWTNIWSNKKGFNENAEWITREEARTRAIEEQEWKDITTKELNQTLTKAHKWESPGHDKVPNFWLNSLTSTHEQLTKSFCDIMRSPENTSEWLMQGATYAGADPEKNLTGARHA